MNCTLDLKSRLCISLNIKITLFMYYKCSYHLIRNKAFQSVYTSYKNRVDSNNIELFRTPTSQPHTTDRKAI